jgi:hypothetical protein
MKLAKECLGEYLKEASPSLVGQERKIWATLEAFDWPEEYANVQESLVRYYAQNPEEYRAALARDEHLVSWPTCPKTHLRSFWSGRACLTPPTPSWSWSGSRLSSSPRP